MKQHKTNYLAHLERISDFLFCGKDIWWSLYEEGVEFKDSGEEPRQHKEGPVLHHFRSSDQEKEKMFLKDLWNKCLEEGVALPHPKIKVYDYNSTPVRTVVNKEFEVQDTDS